MKSIYIKSPLFEPILDLEMINFAKWVAQYYHTGIGMVLQSMIPKALNVEYVQKPVLHIWIYLNI